MDPSLSLGWLWDVRLPIFVKFHDGLKLQYQRKKKKTKTGEICLSQIRRFNSAKEKIVEVWSAIIGHFQRRNTELRS